MSEEQTVHNQFPTLCLHRARRPLGMTNAEGKRCGCMGKWLYPCAVHGQCTIRTPRPEVACCVTCKDFEEV